jgi:hypothetical protein
MDEYDITVAALSNLERLSGADRDHPHLNAGCLCERGKQITEQTRLLGRGRRGDRNKRLLRDR